MSSANESRTAAGRRAAGWAAGLLLLCASAASAQDTDGDRLPNGVENAIGTNPALADTDGDGDSDWLEYYRCRSPLDAADQGPTKCRAAVGGDDPGWRWSENGPIAGMNCVRITIPQSPTQWANTYLCTTHFTGWRWSTSGPLPGVSCVQWREGADPAWSDGTNYLCGPPDNAPLRRWTADFFFWAGPTALPVDPRSCVRITNAALPGPVWADNYFCQSDSRVLVENVSCSNCASADLANGAVLAMTARGTNGVAFTGLPPGITVDGEACTPVPGEPLKCRLPAGRFGDLGFGRLLLTSDQRMIVDFPAPTATSITPAALPAIGGTITLQGQHFGIDAATATVGGQPCTVVSRSHDTLTCQAPPRPPGIASVRVTVGNQVSNALTVTYRAAPTVKGIGVVGAAPTAGGGRIVVLGSALDTSPSMFVGGVACVLQTIEPDLLICRMPPGRGTDVAVLLNVDGQTFSGTADYDPPVITDVSGLDGPTAGGGVVTLNGANFGNQPSGVVVTIGTGQCTFGGGGSIDHTRIDCALPPGQGANVPVRVNVLGRESPAASYRYGAPSLLPFGPLRIGTAGGEILEVRGNNLGTSGTVRIAGEPCATTGAGTSHGHTLIRCRTPEGVGLDQPLQVDISGQVAQTSISYRAPVLTGGTLTAGPTLGGNEIELLGTDLGASSLSVPRSVEVGAAACQVLAASHTSLRCRVPPGQGRNVAVRAIVGGQSSNALDYSYRAPLVLDVVPGTLPTAGGVQVTIRGQDFGPNAQVTIGTSLCQGNFASDSVVTCIAPPGSAGATLLRLAAANQQSNAVALQYAANPVMVALHKGGDGFGAIASTPSGLACDATCTSRENLFPPGTAVTLTAQAAAGSAFLGWQGPCTGTAPTCSFTADADTVVMARFGSPLFESGFETAEGD